MKIHNEIQYRSHSILVFAVYSVDGSHRLIYKPSLPADLAYDTLNLAKSKIDDFWAGR
jgi:hypothetical protein